MTDLEFKECQKIIRENTFFTDKQKEIILSKSKDELRDALNSVFSDATKNINQFLRSYKLRFLNIPFANKNEIDFWQNSKPSKLVGWKSAR